MISLLVSAGIVVSMPGADGRPDWDKLTVPVSGISGCRTVSINEPGGLPATMERLEIFIIENVDASLIDVTPLDESVYGVGKFGAEMSVASLAVALQAGGKRLEIH